MTTSVQRFDFVFEQQHIRVLTTEHGYEFVAKDICRPLGYTRARNALRLLDPDEKGCSKMSTPGGPQEMLTVTEPGLYQLVFRSGLPQAKHFQRWVLHDVLPVLRQEGQYTLPATTENLIAQTEQLIAALKRLQPKAQMYDIALNSATWYSLEEVAKTLHVPGMGRNNLFAFLRRVNWLQANNHPYQKYIDRGYFKLVERHWEAPDGATMTGFKTVVSERGQASIYRKLEQTGYLATVEETS